MKKILVVDDELEIRNLLKARLAQNNYEALVASNGGEALSICKEANPDLLLLDIAMPLMDGYQVSQQIRNDPQTKKIPILFLTGKDLDEHGIIERCQKLGACDFIAKLATLKELLEKVKEIIG